MIYLDNSATTKPFPEVVQTMVRILTEEYGNPSSLYQFGIQAEKQVKHAREQIARMLRTSQEEIYFTSGGTESNNMAIMGIIQADRGRKRKLITSAIEHPSVMEVFLSLEQQGYDVVYLEVDREGYISLEQLESEVNNETLLVSIMHVNNEIGSIQNIKEIGNIIKKKNHSTYFHVDGVQAFGKVPVSVKDSNIDLYSISAHKIHGPKGVGALYVKKGTRLQSLFLGGGQEKGYRSGTENVPGISGLGKAVEIYYEHQQEYIEHLIALKRDLAERITENIEQTAINGPSVEDGAPHILNISFAGIRGEVLLHALEQKGVLVSTGSACSSRKKDQPCTGSNRVT